MNSDRGKRLCKHWLAGSCRAGNGCKFIHGEFRVDSARNIQNVSQAQITNAALHESPNLMNMRNREAAMFKQQFAVQNMTQQGLLQQQAMAARQPGLMGLPLMAQHMAGVQQNLMMNPGLLQQQQQLHLQQQLQQLQQQNILSGQAVQGMPGFQTNVNMELGNLQAVQQQNLLQSQTAPGTTGYSTSLHGGLQTTGSVTIGKNRKRRSRFHDSNEVLIPSLDVANGGDQNPRMINTAKRLDMKQGFMGQVGMSQVPPLQIMPVGADAAVSRHLSVTADGQMLLPSIGQIPMTAAVGHMNMSAAEQIPFSVPGPMSQLATGQMPLSNPGQMPMPAGQMAIYSAGQMPMSFPTSQRQILESLGQEQCSQEQNSSTEYILEGGSQRKKSRFHQRDQQSAHPRTFYSDSFDEGGDFVPSAETEYQPDEPTEDDDFIEDFVDKIMAGSRPRIIQPEDNKKKKGITIKNMFVPAKKKSQPSRFQKEIPGYEQKLDPQRSLMNRTSTRGVYEQQRDRHDLNRSQDMDNAYQIEDRNVYAGRSRFERESESKYSRRTSTMRSPDDEDEDYSFEYNRDRLRQEESGFARDANRFQQQARHANKKPNQMQMQAARSQKGGRQFAHRNVDEESYSEYETQLPQASTRRRPASTFIRDFPSDEPTSSTRNKVDAEHGIVSPREISYGKNLPSFIVKFMKNSGRYKAGVQRVTKTFKLPINCIGLTPPKLNSDAWEILTKKAQTRDHMLQDMQRWFASGVIPLIKQVDFFGKGVQSMQTVCHYTSDSLNVLSFVLSSISIKRRLLLRNALHKKYGILCRRTAPVTKLLFGDTLATDLLSVKAGTFEIPETEANSLDQNNDDPDGENFKPMFFPNLAIPEDEVDESVAGIINMACANDGDVSDLQNKFRIPANCETIVPPKINPEMWSLISRSGLELDYRLQDVHLSIAEGMVPMMILLQSVHENNYDENNAISLLTDALLLLGNSAYQINKVRMDAMRRSLPEQVHGYCGFVWPGADHVSLENVN